MERGAGRLTGKVCVGVVEQDDADLSSVVLVDLPAAGGRIVGGRGRGTKKQGGDRWFKRSGPSKGGIDHIIQHVVLLPGSSGPHHAGAGVNEVLDGQARARRHAGVSAGRDGDAQPGDRQRRRRKRRARFGKAQIAAKPVGPKRRSRERPAGSRSSGARQHQQQERGGRGPAS